MNDMSMSIRSADAISFVSSVIMDASFFEFVKRKERVSDVAGLSHVRSLILFARCSRDFKRN